MLPDGIMLFAYDHLAGTPAPMVACSETRTVHPLQPRVRKPVSPAHRPATTSAGSEISAHARETLGPCLMLAVVRRFAAGAKQMRLHAS